MVRLFTILAVIASWHLAAFANGAMQARAEVDIALGEYLSTACVTCHQLSGVDNGIPSIVGWEPKAFITTLKSYKSKERANPVMQMITQPMTDEEMESLAAYFASIKPVEKNED